MPRRSGGGGGGSFMSRPKSSMPSRPRPAPAPMPARSNVPAPAPTPAAAAPSQGPGLMGQMAATAGGVAIGSAVGHGLGNMLFGGRGGGEEVQQQQQMPVQGQEQAVGGRPLQQPCEFEMKQFLDCTQGNDLSLCQGFNQALKECRARYGV